jgi:hypothetical protein
MQEITLQIILRTVVGVDEGAELTALRQQIKRLLSAAEHRVSLPAMVYLSTRAQLESRIPFKWMLEARNDTDALLYRQIAARRVDRRLRPSGRHGGRGVHLSRAPQPGSVPAARGVPSRALPRHAA